MHGAIGFYKQSVSQSVSQLLRARLISSTVEYNIQLIIEFNIIWSDSRVVSVHRSINCTYCMYRERCSCQSHFLSRDRFRYFKYLSFPSFLPLYPSFPMPSSLLPSLLSTTATTYQFTRWWSTLIVLMRDVTKESEVREGIHSAHIILKFVKSSTVEQSSLSNNYGTQYCNLSYTHWTWKSSKRTKVNPMRRGLWRKLRH